MSECVCTPCWHKPGGICLSPARSCRAYASTGVVVRRSCTSHRLLVLVLYCRQLFVHEPVVFDFSIFDGVSAEAAMMSAMTARRRVGFDSRESVRAYLATHVR